MCQLEKPHNRLTQEQNCRQAETLCYPIGFGLQTKKHPGRESRVFIDERA